MIACDEGGRCRVQGAVTMLSATALLAESAALFTAPHLVVDLSGVTEVDSAAVSVLLEWRREASKAKRSIEFVNLPSNLRSLAELYGVLALIMDRSVKTEAT